MIGAAFPAFCQTPQSAVEHSFLQKAVPGVEAPTTEAEAPDFPFAGRVPSRPFLMQPTVPQMSGRQLDREIIRRPPMDAFRQQPPRKPMANSLYPDLKVLPIETARLEPIPVYFPEFKLEPIPITAPELKAIPIAATDLRGRPGK
ncbi:hypothetical protein DYQ86_02600 [Acidobacteria bacterium AB60]|nr:hypothetical protein DYQ86_02600 [Acidobacteria bacterium AB60]